VELDLLRAILYGDTASRVVYADWLEQHARPHHAEFVRLQEVVRDPDRGATARARLEVLSNVLDSSWQVQVARPQVEDCETPGCPDDWSEMTCTDPAAEVRRCGVCDRAVRYCSTGDRAVDGLRAGERIVFAAGAERTWTCGYCAHGNPFDAKFCLACGTDRLSSATPPSIVEPVVLRNPPSPRRPEATCPRCGAPSYPDRPCTRCAARE